MRLLRKKNEIGNFRVEQFVTSPFPHISGRAAFPHTVLLTIVSYLQPLPIFENVLLRCISQQVRFMFPIFNSIFRHPPSLLTDFPWVNFPAFISTMRLIRLPSPLSYPSISLGLDITCGTSLFLTSFQMGVGIGTDKTIEAVEENYRHSALNTLPGIFSIVGKAESNSICLFSFFYPLE